MQDEDIVSANEFCIHHGVEISFIHSLREYGLIETLIVEEKIYLPAKQLSLLEKIVRFHNDLDINLEGIDSIIHLLQRMQQMQQQITQLTNRLRKYETI